VALGLRRFFGNFVEEFEGNGAVRGMSFLPDSKIVMSGVPGTYVPGYGMSPLRGCPD